MANTAIANTSMNTDTSAPPTPSAPPLAPTEELRAGEYFIDTNDANGTTRRRFYRITPFDAFDGTESEHREKKPSLQTKGIEKKPIQKKEDKEKKAKKKKEKKREKKDPNQPKGPQTAYFHYMNNHRGAIKQKLEADGVNGKELTKTIPKVASEQWKALSGDDKKVYEDLHLEDKRRYEEEMKDYKELQSLEEQRCEETCQPGNDGEATASSED